jgi:hypothetical protein
MNNSKTVSTFLATQSKIMNVSQSSLRYNGCSTIQRRLLIEKSITSNDNNNNDDSKKPLMKLQTGIGIFYNLSTSIAVSTKNIVVSSGDAATANELFNKLSNLLAQSINSGYCDYY